MKPKEWLSQCDKMTTDIVDWLHMTIEKEWDKVIIRAMEQLGYCMRCAKRLDKSCDNSQIEILLMFLENNN